MREDRVDPANTPANVGRTSSSVERVIKEEDVEVVEEMPGRQAKRIVVPEEGSVVEIPETVLKQEEVAIETPKPPVEVKECGGFEADCKAKQESVKTRDLSEERTLAVTKKESDAEEKAPVIEQEKTAIENDEVGVKKEEPAIDIRGRAFKKEDSFVKEEPVNPSLFQIHPNLLAPRPIVAKPTTSSKNPQSPQQDSPALTSVQKQNIRALSTESTKHHKMSSPITKAIRDASRTIIPSAAGSSSVQLVWTQTATTERGQTTAETPSAGGRADAQIVREGQEMRGAVWTPINPGGRELTITAKEYTPAFQRQRQNGRELGSRDLHTREALGSNIASSSETAASNVQPQGSNAPSRMSENNAVGQAPPSAGLLFRALTEAFDAGGDLGTIQQILAERGFTIERAINAVAQALDTVLARTPVSVPPREYALFLQQANLEDIIALWEYVQDPQMDVESFRKMVALLTNLLALLQPMNDQRQTTQNGGQPPNISGTLTTEQSVMGMLLKADDANQCCIDLNPSHQELPPVVDQHQAIQNPVQPSMRQGMLTTEHSVTGMLLKTENANWSRTDPISLHRGASSGQSHLQATHVPVQQSKIQGMSKAEHLLTGMSKRFKC